MRLDRRFFALGLALGLLLTGCAEPGPLPDVPVVDPNDPGPVNPPAPVPDQPPDNPPTTSGTITEAQFAAVPEGATEAEVRSALGSPFQTTNAAGFHLLKYALADGVHLATFWILDGKVSHKTRL